MVGSDAGPLTAAVSNAGGLGSVGLGMLDIETVERSIDDAASRTNRAINLNFMVAKAAETPPDVLEAIRGRLKPWYSRATGWSMWAPARASCR